MKKGTLITSRGTFGDTIEVRKPLPGWVKTPELYMPSRTPSSAMTLQQARRGLCHKSGGNLDACRVCPSPCPMGKRCMELVDQGETLQAPSVAIPEKPAKPPEPKKPKVKARAAKRGMDGFADRLRTAFENKGISQSELARRIGSKQSSVSCWLKTGAIPPVPIVADICRTLEISADWLLGLEVGE